MKSLKAMPFDSNEILDEATGEASFDRVAYSADLAKWLGTYISNGVLIKGGDTLGNELKVTHKEALTVTVDTGAICINGRTGWNDEACDLTVSMGGTYPRIDRVVAELNIPNDRDIYIKVLEGTPAEEPTAPELTQTDDVYQIPLAQIRVEASSASVASVTDERADYISNITIGIKPPTGNDAVAVKVSEKIRNLYGISENEASIETALEKNPPASYLAFVTNANTDSLDAAFGKNNEEDMQRIGRALAMYAWFKGDSKEEYPFTALKKFGTLREIFNNADSFAELCANENVNNLVKASPFASTFSYTGEKAKELYNAEAMTFDEKFGNFTKTVLKSDYSYSTLSYASKDGTTDGVIGGVMSYCTSTSSSAYADFTAVSPNFVAETTLLMIEDVTLSVTNSSGIYINEMRVCDDSRNIVARFGHPGGVIYGTSMNLNYPKNLISGLVVGNTYHIEFVGRIESSRSKGTAVTTDTCGSVYFI